MAIWEEKFECCRREELQQLQLERIQSTLNRVYKSVPFYKKVFNDQRIVPEDISTLEEFKRLPFTTRKDLTATIRTAFLPFLSGRSSGFIRRVKRSIRPP
jgi:phenylacetate-coenzyme A ligase PaaK-like adenylate-forming protein